MICCSKFGTLEEFGDAFFAVDVSQESLQAARWLCIQAVKLYVQANDSGRWNCQDQKQDLSQPVRGPRSSFD
jgi:hypothetical protein